MADYVCIDSGTTNTRISLVRDNNVIDTMKYHCGTKCSKDELKLTLKKGISEILVKNNADEKTANKIIASGMITSELGLIDLEHITAPVGLKELNEGIVEKSFEDISSIPFSFIRGVKIFGENLDDTDMLRGEEAELFGIIDGEGVYVLPGSHSKILVVDDTERITTFKTMLTGEMLSSIAANTILKESLPDISVTADEEYLFVGLSYAREHGINEALFKVRVLKNIFKKSNEQVMGFFMGAVLCDEINFILSLSPKKITIGGNAILKKPMSVILNKLSSSKVITLNEEEVEKCVALGQVRIFEYKNKG